VTETQPSLSVVMPARNEAAALRQLLPTIKSAWPLAEIVVVDDGSTDDTAALCEEHKVVRVAHPYSMGNGAAIKSGARKAAGKVLIFMDADGQHQVHDIERLLQSMENGYDMVVGARDSTSQASPWRHLGNRIYNRLASWVTGHRVLDLTSGFRAVRADRFREFLFLLPNGFSYPTTITMAFFRSGYPVTYLPIHANDRIGKSHIRPFTDGLRFLVIIAKIATFYSPLKVFSPVSFVLFLMGVGNYLYTFLNGSRFTNMTAALLIISILVFLLGLISEQITSLIYTVSDRDHSHRLRH
jgi:glycosyltransferase involved in cell wall biosynthesis